LHAPCVETPATRTSWNCPDSDTCWQSWRTRSSETPSESDPSICDWDQIDGDGTAVSGCCCSELEECWSNGSHMNSQPDRSSPAVVTSASITSSGSMTARTGWTSRRRGARPRGEARAPTGTTPGVPPPPASSQQCAACHPSGGRRGRPQWPTGGDCENRCPITGAR
jgi:hypothetical protein